MGPLVPQALELLALLLLLQVGARATVDPGWLIPDKVESAIGGNFTISCTLNETYFRDANISRPCTVKDLYFKAGKREYHQHPDIRTLNNTTILFTAVNAEEQEGEYMCMCREYVINTSKVYVGTRPMPIRDFDCIDYDFQFMVCNFTQPPNKLITKYFVTYNANNDWHYSNSVDCNFDAAPVVTCNMTDDNYKRFSDTYYFRLNMTNALGAMVQPITINHFERTVPSRPGQNLTLVSRTENSVCLSWEMKQRSNYAHGLVWEVRVTPLNFETLKRPFWRNNSSSIKDTLCLTELPFAGYSYTLQLRVRGNLNNTIWSDPLVYNFATAPARPRRPPRVTYGSFYVDSSEEGMRFYWEPLERHEENGPGFCYTISEYRINGILVDPSLIKVGRDSAVINHWNMSGVHEILIRSNNSEGLSVNATRMSIGPITNRDLRQRVPRNIHGVYQQTNKSTLTWEPPEDQRELTNYTVFWCVPKPGLLSECKESIRFAEVPSDQLMFTTVRDQQTLLMAVSANYRSHNSGLRWPKCSSDKTDDLAKMEPSIDVTTNTTMTVSWGTEHVCAVILAGYNLTYCQRSTGRPDNCTTVQLDHFSNKYEIRHLVPYTDYSVKMLMYSETRASKYSDELVNRTGEAAPSQPRELQLLRVTRSGVELSWKPPLLANGMVRSYEGTFRSQPDNVTESFRVPALISELVDTEKPITHLLGNLTAFTSYEVSVRARTLYLSEPSNSVTFRTAIGVPSPPTLQVTNNKDQSSRLDWHPPRTPAGRIDYYEVSLLDSNASCLMSTILSGHNRSFVMATPRCTSHNPFQLAVRAINVDRQEPTGAEEAAVVAAQSSPFSCEVQRNVLGDEERAQYEMYGANASAYRLYKSEWGTFGYICTSDTNSVKAMYQTIEVTVAILVLGVIFYLVYKKYRKMSDIDLVLPQGIMETLKKPMDMGGLGLDLGPNSSVSGGIICTRVDDSPQYTPQDHLPHDFSSCGGESSKLLLRTASSSGNGGCMDRNGYDDHRETGPMSGAVPPPTSYLSMRHGLLVQSDSETEREREREQESEHERERDQQDGDNINREMEPTSGGGGGSSSSNGYIKPTQMKSWAGNGGPPVQSQPLPRVPLSGYVPVPILQSRLNPLPPPQANANAPSAAAAASTFFPPAHLLNMDNYVQASDLHKLKPLAAAPLPSVGIGEGVGAAAAAAAGAPTQPQPQPTFQLPVVAASTPTSTPTPKLADIGYTTMEQLQLTGLMKQPPLSAAVGGPTMHASGAATGSGVGNTHPRLQPPINGYVTPQDLNVLAHNNRHVL